MITLIGLATMVVTTGLCLWVAPPLSAELPSWLYYTYTAARRAGHSW